MDRQDVKEKLFTIALFTGVFLPVRLVFYTYVSPYWLGSFGLITAIMVTLIILSRKGKLGYVGYIIQKQVMSFSKGRFGKLALFNIIFFIYVFSLAIYGIESAPEELKQQMINTLAQEGVTDLDTAIDSSDRLVWTGPGAAIPFFSVIVILTPNNLGAVIYSLMNDFTDGWLLHFTTVFLIEELEVLGLVVYFRYIAKTR